MFEVEADEAEEGVIGDPGVAELPTAPDTLVVAPCLGACWRRN